MFQNFNFSRFKKHSSGAIGSMIFSCNLLLPLEKTGRAKYVLFCGIFQGWAGTWYIQVIILYTFQVWKQLNQLS